MVLIDKPWRTVTPLNEWLKLNPTMLGQRMAPAPAGLPRSVAERRRLRMSHERHELPFLFKVLSVRTALSIQVCARSHHSIHTATPHSP
jgi:hypothetical protein